MKIIGYIRVSTDKQDAESQRHLLLEYAHTWKNAVKQGVTPGLTKPHCKMSHLKSR